MSRSSVSVPRPRRGRTRPEREPDPERSSPVGLVGAQPAHVAAHHGKQRTRDTWRCPEHAVPARGHGGGTAGRRRGRARRRADRRVDRGPPHQRPDRLCLHRPRAAPPAAAHPRARIAVDLRQAVLHRQACPEALRTLPITARAFDAELVAIETNPVLRAQLILAGVDDVNASLDAAIHHGAPALQPVTGQPPSGAASPSSATSSSSPVSTG